MRLFAVRLSDNTLLASTSNPNEPVYFDDKMQAKRIRDQYPGAVVVLGPDHARYFR